MIRQLIFITSFAIALANALEAQAVPDSLHLPTLRAAALGQDPRAAQLDVRTRTTRLQLVYNAEDGALAGVTNSYAQQIIASYARELGANLVPIVASSPRIEIRSRGWYNQDLDYKDYMIPGILVQLLTLVGTLLTAMNIVREKELGTLDQLNVTPVPRSAFIAAKLIPLWTIALLELALGVDRCALVV